MEEFLPWMLVVFSLPAGGVPADGQILREPGLYLTQADCEIAATQRRKPETGEGPRVWTACLRVPENTEYDDAWRAMQADRSEQVP